MGTQVTKKKKKNYALSYGTLSRRNDLINAKYTSTLIENKLLLLSIYSAKISDDGTPIARLSTEEVRRVTGVKGNGLYETLKNAASSLVGRTLFIENEIDGKKEFKFLSLIPECSFKNGIFEVKLNKSSKDFLYNLKSGFSNVNLALLMTFKSNYSFRLFDLLNVYKYLIDEKNTPYEIPAMNVSELRFKLNTIDTEQKQVKNLLSKFGSKKTPDWDMALEECTRMKVPVKYPTWASFRKDLLDPSIKEINKTTAESDSGLFVSYDTIRHGRGGKVTQIIFTIQRNVGQTELIYPKEETSGSSEPTFWTDSEIEQVLAIMSNTKLKRIEVVRLLNLAGGNVEEIRRVYEISKSQGRIRNLMGWMTEALRNHYDEPIEVEEGDAETAQVADQIRNHIESNKQTLAVQQWEKYKKREEFKEFEKWIKSELLMGINELEEFNSSADCVNYFIRWKMSTLQKSE